MENVKIIPLTNLFQHLKSAGLLVWFKESVTISLALVKRQLNRE